MCGLMQLSACVLDGFGALRICSAKKIIACLSGRGKNIFSWLNWGRLYWSGTLQLDCLSSKLWFVVPCVVVCPWSVVQPIQSSRFSSSDILYVVLDKECVQLCMNAGIDIRGGISMMQGSDVAVKYDCIDCDNWLTSTWFSVCQQATCIVEFVDH